MNNDLKCDESKKGTCINSEKIFNVIIREIPNREYSIKVGEHVLAATISVLSKQFSIEIK